MPKKKNKDATSNAREEALLPSTTLRHAYVPPWWSEIRSMAIGEVTTSTEITQLVVRASPRSSTGGPDGTADIDPALAIFAERLNLAPPLFAAWSNDRVQNTLILHAALRAKWNHVKVNCGVDCVMSVNTDSPIALLHRIDPNDRWKWYSIGSGQGFGANVYRVTIGGNQFQSVGIQYITEDPTGPEEL